MSNINVWIERSTTLDSFYKLNCTTGVGISVVTYTSMYVSYKQLDLL